MEQYGTGKFIRLKSSPDKKDIDCARNGLDRATGAMLSGNYSIVVLDEILSAYNFKLVTLDDILSVVNRRPSGVELILTGRNAPQEIIDIADLVTEMVEVKHYFQKGVAARTGIEK